MADTPVEVRFALIASNGDVLHPYKKSQRSTGRYGFALSKPGSRDAHSEGDYVDTIEQVIRRVVFDGYKVRVTTTNKLLTQRNGSLKIGGQSIVGYWVADELRHMVIGVPTAPRMLPKY